MSLANIIKQFLAVMDASGDLPETADHLAALALVAEQARTELERLQTLDPPLRPYQQRLLDQIERVAGATDRPRVAVAITPRRISHDEWLDALGSGMTINELIAAGILQAVPADAAFGIEVKTNADGMSRENEAQSALYEEQISESIQEWVARVAGSPSAFMQHIQQLGRADRKPPRAEVIDPKTLARIKWSTIRYGRPTLALAACSTDDTLLFVIADTEDPAYACHRFNNCFRACLGITDDELINIVSSGETLKSRLNEAMTAKEKAERERDELRTYCQELLAALKQFTNGGKTDDLWSRVDVLYDKAKKLLTVRGAA